MGFDRRLKLTQIDKVPRRPAPEKGGCRRGMAEKGGTARALVVDKCVGGIARSMRIDASMAKKDASIEGIVSSIYLFVALEPMSSFMQGARCEVRGARRELRAAIARGSSIAALDTNNVRCSPCRVAPALNKALAVIYYEPC